MMKILYLANGALPILQIQQVKLQVYLVNKYLVL